MGETASRVTFWPRLGRWAAELILVFIGVYAAFWLNNFQQRQQDAERRDRILASIERTLREGIESGKINRVKEERRSGEISARARCRRNAAFAIHSFSSPTTVQATSRPCFNPAGSELLDLETLDCVAQGRIGHSLGTKPPAALSKIERRTDRAESRPGHFVLLRSGAQKNCGNVLKYIPKPCKQR